MNGQQLDELISATLRAMREDAKISIEITKKGSSTTETVVEAEGSCMALVGMLSAGLGNIINKMTEGDRVLKDTAIKTIAGILGYDDSMIRPKESK